MAETHEEWLRRHNMVESDNIPPGGPIVSFGHTVNTAESSYVQVGQVWHEEMWLSATDSSREVDATFENEFLLER